MVPEAQGEPDELQLTGAIIQGTRGASGLSWDGIGSIARQKGIFANQGVPGANEWFNGTINIALYPDTFSILRPDYIVSAKWQPDDPMTEFFWLVDVALEYGGAVYPACIYYPRPSKVKLYDDDVIEVVAQPIAGLRYGQEITLIVSARKIQRNRAAD